MRKTLSRGILCAFFVSSTALSGAALAQAPAQTLAASQPSAIAPLAEAKGKLRQARRNLSAAEDRMKKLDRRATKDRERLDKARATLAQLAREAYIGGPSEMVEIASFITGDDPTDALRNASQVADFADDQRDRWDDASETLRRTNKLGVTAAKEVQQARRELRSAFSAVLKSQSGRGRQDGPGTTKLEKQCRESDSISPICIYPSWSEFRRTFDAVLAGRYVNVRWPQIQDIGGWRPYDAFPDHPSGRAIDIMMPNGGGGSDVGLGNDIAEYFMENAKEYGVHYIIWRQRMWKSSSKPGEWRGLTNRGSATANHFDHIHISFTDGSSATIGKDLLNMKDIPG
jgi:hypothetical protein